MNDDIGLAKQGTAQTRNFSSRHSDLQFKKHVPKITKSIFEKQGVDSHSSRGKVFRRDLQTVQKNISNMGVAQGKISEAERMRQEGA